MIFQSLYPVYKLKTALYVRVSTKEQAKEGYSINAQIQRLIGFGWEITHKFIDDGYSAKDLECKT